MKKTCLGVVAAMPQEIAPLLRRLKGYQKERTAGFNLYRFTHAGSDVVLIESGMGPSHATAATKTLISLADPKLILNFGFAGAVRPGIEVGDLVLADRVLLLEGGRLTSAPQPEPGISARLLEACRNELLTIHSGTFITAATIMNKQTLAGSLEQGITHPVLEMETAAVLGAAFEAGIPVVAVRGVSDAAQQELGFSLEEFCDAQLRISLPRILGCIARKPWIIPQLMQLSRDSKKAGYTLGLCVELALKTLAPL
jgi:adenosylhomocysteine nucleosidase